MKYIITLLSMILILSCNTKVVKEEAEQDEILATWRGGQITLKEFEDFALKNSFNYDQVIAAESSIEKKREALDKMINSKVIWNIYDSLRLDTVKVIQYAFEKRLYRTAYNFTLFIDSVQNKIVTEKSINEFYNILKNKYNISHILVEDEKIAKSIYDGLNNKTNSFHEYAKKYSIDASNSEDGGNLSWNVITNFVPEFSDAVLKIKKGEITKPFKTKFGWHIAKLNDIQANKELGSIEKEMESIRRRILTLHKNEFDSLNNEWENFLLNKYNVFVDSQKVNEFVNYFQSLSKKDINSACDYSYYKTDLVLSAFDGDTVTVKNALDNISRSVKSALDLSKNVPDLKVNDVHGLIFYTHVFKIRPLISEELGYTKRVDVLNRAKEGLISDLKEYLIQNYDGTKELENKWFSTYLKGYNLSINYTVFENSFYKPKDDRK